MHRYRNKIAIVTGASSGIGAAISKRLVNEGVIVVGISRGIDKLEELRETFSNSKSLFYPYAADVTKENDILEAFKWVTTILGPIHILVNSAGIVRITNLINGKTTDWKDVLDTNAIGLCIATREAVKNMNENNVEGHVIHINSIAGHSVPPDTPIYSATKHAVTALTETLRQELNKQRSKIKITSVSPGHVKTNIFTSAISKCELDVSNEIDALISNMPGLQPEDVADSVMYALGTPPHVQVHELIIKPVGEIF